MRDATPINSTHDRRKLQFPGIYYMEVFPYSFKAIDTVHSASENCEHRLAPSLWPGLRPMLSASASPDRYLTQLGLLPILGRASRTTAATVTIKSL